MGFDQQRFIDALTRAYEMEEKMASALMDITQPELFSGDFSPAHREAIMKVLLSIKADTARHKQVALSTLKQFSKEPR